MRYKACLFSLEVTGALVSSLPASEAEEEIVRSCLNFPCQKRKEASSCRLRDRWSALLFREVGGACVLNSSLLVGDEVQNLCVAFEYWGSSVHVFRGELSSIFVGFGAHTRTIQSS